MKLSYLYRHNAAAARTVRRMNAAYLLIPQHRAAAFAFAVDVRFSVAETVFLQSEKRLYPVINGVELLPFDVPLMRAARKKAEERVNEHRQRKREHDEIRRDVRHKTRDYRDNEIDDKQKSAESVKPVSAGHKPRIPLAEAEQKTSHGGVS